MTAITDSSNHKTVLHGVLVNVDDIGVLITGESGTGKSECALELIVRRGHRLVADDVVEVTRYRNRLEGQAPKRLAGLLNARDVGIVSVRELFGDFSFEPAHTIDICIQFETGESHEGAGQIGLDISESEILGLKVPLFIISNCAGRNLPLLVETAVKTLDNREECTGNAFLREHDALVFTPGSC